MEGPHEYKAAFGAKFKYRVVLRGKICQNNLIESDEKNLLNFNNNFIKNKVWCFKRQFQR